MRNIPFFALAALLFVWGCQESGSNGSADADTQSEEASAPNEPRSPRDQTIEDEALASPESVIGDGEFYYVSNVGQKLEPSNKDGDGYISKLDGEGNIVEARFMTGLDAPKGSAIINGTFYVADIDQVRMYDISTGEAKGEIDLSSEEVNFLNDLVEGPDGTLFVSATDKNRIFQVNPADGSVSRLETSSPILSPNGLWYEPGPKHLYVVTYEGEDGRAMRLNLNQKPAQIELLDKYRGSLDGVVKLGDYLLVSDWNTQSLVILDIANGGSLVQEHPMPIRIQGPADFYYDDSTGELWVPGMQMNKIFVKTSAIQ